MSGKNSTPMNTHVPSNLANALGIKSNGPYRRFVNGEFIAATPQEARQAAAMGYTVANEETSFAERWNGGKPVDASHPGYAAMVANKAVNTLMGTSVRPNCGPFDVVSCEPTIGMGLMNPQNGLYGHIATRTMPTQPPLGAFKSTVPVTSSTVPDTIADSVATRTVPVTSSTMPVTSSKNHGVDDEQYQIDLATAISLSEASLMVSAQPTPTKDGDPIEMVMRLSMGCVHCHEPFKSATAKFCEECGSRR